MLSYYDRKEKTNNFIAKEIKDDKIIKTTNLLSVPVEKKSKMGSFVFTTSYDEYNHQHQQTLHISLVLY